MEIQFEETQNEIKTEEEEVQNKQYDVNIVKQFLACMPAYMMGLAVGANAGFSAVTIPQLQDSGGFELSDEEVSWFASLPSFAMIPTCVIGGVLGQHVGRKLGLVLVGPMFFVSFVCQAAAGDVGLLQFGRVLGGLSAGLVSSPASTYVSEISHPDWRTTFGAGIGLSYLIGMVVIYTLGAFTHWRVIAAISAVFPLFAFVTGLYIPESPAWLVTKDRFVEAKDSLRWLHVSPGMVSRMLMGMTTKNSLPGNKSSLEEDLERLKVSYKTAKQQNLKKQGQEENGPCNLVAETEEPSSSSSR